MGNAVLLFALLAAIQVSSASTPTQQPVIPRDAARTGPARTGTAVIRGQVTDRETGQPIARANVTLISSGMQPDAAERSRQVRTTAEGRYEFTDLPAGEYRIMVNAGEYRYTHLLHFLGESRPVDHSRPTPFRPFTLKDGEVREDADVALWRAFAVEGRVVDEYGDPLGGVEVSIKIAETSRRPGMQGNQIHTDDRGFFRVYGLAPGRYFVCANPRNHGNPAEEVRERPIETCHPSASIDADAQAVAVTNGDVGGVEIRVLRSRAHTVTGMAVDSSGAPLERGHVSLVRIEREGASGSGIEMQPDGQFIARGLVPGEYAIRAEIGSMFNPSDTREREIGYVPFRIDTSNVEGLVVATSKTSRVAGRVVFEDAGPNEAAGSIRIQAVPDMRNRMILMGPQPNVQVKSNLTFELSGLFGPSAILVSGMPPGWVVRSVRYRAQDVTDTLVDFGGVRESDVIEIALTNRGARVSGRVTSEGGQPAPDSRVVLLPADPARWRAMSFAMGGGVVKPDGSYQLGPVRAGEYLMVAISLADTPQMLPDQDYFERIARAAQRITLVENDQPTIDLAVSKLR
jgi:Carboxypeptidase regulatory-like domain